MDISWSKVTLILEWKRKWSTLSVLLSELQHFPWAVCVCVFLNYLALSGNLLGIGDLTLHYTRHFYSLSVLWVHRQLVIDVFLLLQWRLSFVTSCSPRMLFSRFPFRLRDRPIYYQHHNLSELSILALPYISPQENAVTPILYLKQLWTPSLPSSHLHLSMTFWTPCPSEDTLPIERALLAWCPHREVPSPSCVLDWSQLFVASQPLGYPGRMHLGIRCFLCLTPLDLGYGCRYLG